MALFDSLQEILFTLRKNKLRTFLTAFGVFWGVFLLILLLGAGEGLKNGAQSGFSENTNDVVWMWTGKTSIPYQGLSSDRKIRFKESDIAAIKREVAGVLDASGENPLGSAHNGDNIVSYKDKSGSFVIIGVGKDVFKIKTSLEARKGRKINPLDQEQARKTCIIGTAVAKRLFNDINPIGEEIKINGISFLVAGVFFEDGNRGKNSERVYIPLSIFIKTFGQGQRYISTLSYKPKPEYSAVEVEKDVIDLLKKRHHVAPEDKSAIRAFNSFTRSQQAVAMFNAIQIFIWFVGIGTLTAGIVGISNIMLITVKERTVEIGVRKALGARPINIISSLLFESIFVTTLAGYLGLVFGVALLELTQFLLHSANIKLDYFNRPEVNFTMALQAISLLVFFGALAGFIPAWRASKISPVEAMRES